MTSARWRTGRPIEPFTPGNCATSRVAEYIRLWQHRCYGSGIPDEVPHKVAQSGRAPSWRSVAMCILKNDLHLYGLGFATPAYDRQRQVAALAHTAVHGRPPEFHQLSLFP